MGKRKKGTKLEKQFPMHEATHKDVESHELAGENVAPYEIFVDPVQDKVYRTDYVEGQPEIHSHLVKAGAGEKVVLPDGVKIIDVVDVRRHNNEHLEILAWFVPLEEVTTEVPA